MSMAEHIPSRTWLRACTSPRGLMVALLSMAAAFLFAAVALGEPALVLIASFPALASIGQR